MGGFPCFGMGAVQLVLRTAFDDVVGAFLDTQCDRLTATRWRLLTAGGGCLRGAVRRFLSPPMQAARGV